MTRLKINELFAVSFVEGFLFGEFIDMVFLAIIENDDLLLLGVVNYSGGVDGDIDLSYLDLYKLMFGVILNRQFLVDNLERGFVNPHSVDFAEKFNVIHDEFYILDFHFLLLNLYSLFLFGNR